MVIPFFVGKVSENRKNEPSFYNVFAFPQRFPEGLVKMYLKRLSPQIFLAKFSKKSVT